MGKFDRTPMYLCIFIDRHISQMKDIKVLIGKCRISTLPDNVSVYCMCQRQVIYSHV